MFDIRTRRAYNRWLSYDTVVKEYPKLPHYYRDDVLPDDFFEQGEAYVTEKLDGGNFRWMLYDERYADEMPDEVTALDPADGEIVFGTKRNVKGTTAADPDSFKGELRNAFRHLRDDIERDAIRAIHDERGPVVFFGENMAYHTLEGYDFEDAPAVLGFDVCALRETDALHRPADPFEQAFVGFLSFPDAVDVFRRIGVTPVVGADELDPVAAAEIDPEDYQIPKSNFAEGMIAEGVVVRKPDSKYRAKIVREDFEELNRRAWGWSESEAETGNELFVARYCSQARVEKQINRLVVDEGCELSMELIEELWPRVVEDLWEEEWRSIMNDDIEFNPAEVKPLIAGICRETVKRKVKNAELNDADPMETF